MDVSTQDATRTRDTSKIAGVTILFAYFFFFGMILMLVAAASRAYRAHTVNTEWIEAPARVKTCSLRKYYPFVHDGGGVVYSLQCRLSYEFNSREYEYRLVTTSSRTSRMQYVIRDWAAQHGPGTILTVRINPAQPQEVAVISELPTHQFNSSSEALITAGGSAALGLIFLLIGRRLLGRPAA